MFQHQNDANMKKPDKFAALLSGLIMRILMNLTSGSIAFNLSPFFRRCPTLLKLEFC